MGFLVPSDDAAGTVDGVRRWLDADRPEPLLIQTSGSTGRPKRVVLSRDAVLASARATAQRLGSQGRWALVLPSSYVAGAQVIVRSLLSGQPPVVGAWQDARFTSLVPTQLHRMLDEPADVVALASMRAVLLGGAPLDPALRARAEALGVPVVATYGASETAGGCVYDGMALDGVAVAMEATGRIRIAGPTLFDRYEGDPGLSAEALVDGWFVTSDAGRFDEHGRLQVLGRIDDVVISGGVKVPLSAVARRLREHPDLSAVEVLGVPDPQWGQRVVAFVTVASGVPPTPAELRDFVTEAHPRAWAPRQVVVLDCAKSWPVLANGKVDRVTLRGLS